MTLTKITEEITKAAMYHILTAPSGESLNLNEEKLKQYLSEDLKKEIEDHNITKAEINSANVELTINCNDNFNNLKEIAYKAIKNVNPRFKIKEIKDIIIDYNADRKNASYYISAIKTNSKETKVAKLSKEEITQLKKSYENITGYFKNDPEKLTPTDLSLYISKNKIKFIDKQIVWDKLDERLKTGINDATTITKKVASYIEEKGYTLDKDTEKYKIGNFTITPYQIGWDSMYFTALQIDDVKKDKKVVIGFDTASKEFYIHQNKDIVKNNNNAKIILDLYHLVENEDLSDIVLYFLKQILKIK